MNASKRLTIKLNTAAERAAMLSRTLLVQRFSSEDINLLARYMESYYAPKNCTIFRENADDTTLGLLIEGRISIIKKDENGRSKILAQLANGQFFGEMAFIDGNPRSASIRADCNSMILLITKKSFERMTLTNPTLANELLLELTTMISLRLRRTSGALVPFLQAAQNENDR